MFEGASLSLSLKDICVVSSRHVRGLLLQQPPETHAEGEEVAMALATLAHA